MAEITLYAYLQEINALIDEGRPGEAILHTRYILERYPKQIDAYRVLAKAFLEQGELADAADLFQRVLSAYPNDFIGQVGLAIVRKEEGEIDQALWHMERAFEIEPYNAAIREELNDLYGRRDGMPPERLELTRPALARLYVRGELYQQAVSELREILAAGENQVAEQVVLAEALWRDEQRVDAVDACLAVLDRLPNCVQANAILAEIWLLTGRVEDARQYLERVQELTQLSQAELSGDSAPVRAFRADGAYPLPEKLTLSRLAEESALGLPEGVGDADWIEELNLDEGEEDFDWLEAMQSEGVDEAFAGEVEEAADDEEDDFDWLQDVEDDAGTLDLADEMEVALETPGDDAGDELVDWFADDEGSTPVDDTGVPDMKPVSDEPMADQTEGEQDASDDPSDWLQALDGEDADLAGASDWLSEPDAEIQDLAREETDWEEWLEAGTEVAETSEDSVDADVPDWLAEPSDFREEDLGPGSGAAEDDLPDWLGEVDEEIVQADATEPEFADEAEIAMPDDEMELEEVPMGTSEDPRKHEPEEKRPDTEAPETPDVSAAEDDLNWLQELGEVAEEGSATPGSEGEAVPTAAEDLPAWLQDTMNVETGAAESLDWLTDGEEGADLESAEEVSNLPEDEIASEEEEVAPEEEEDLSWLDQIAAGEGAPIEEPPTFSWPEDPEEGDEESEAAAGSGAGETTVAPEELGEAMAWLEQLAASQGVLPEELPSLEDFGEDEQARAELLEEMPTDEEEALAWLETLAGERNIETSEDADRTVQATQEAEFAGDEEDEESIDWLEDLEDAPPAAFVGEETVAFEEEGDEEASDWLDDLEAGEESLDWLAEDEASAFVEGDVAESEAGAEEEPDWLGELEPKEEAELDWLGAAAEIEAAADESAEEPVEEEVQEEPDSLEADGDADDLDWLADLDTAEDEEPDWLDEVEAIEEAGAAEAGDAPEDEPSDEVIERQPEISGAEGDANELDWLADPEGEEEEEPAWLDTEEPDVLAETPVAESEAADVEMSQGKDAEPPEDLEEAMAWLEQLAAQQGAPLEELPSLEQIDAEEAAEYLEEMPGDELEALAWLEELAAEQEETADFPADQETTLVAEDSASREERTAAEGVGVEEEVGAEAEPGAAPAAASDEEVAAIPEPTVSVWEGEDEVPEDLEEAMVWLEQLAAQQGAPDEELPYVQQRDAEEAEAGAAPEVADDVPDEASEDAPILEETLPIAEEAETFVEEAEADDLEIAEARVEMGGTPEPAEDVDEAMAWLEQLASEQDDIPSATAEGEMGMAGDLEVAEEIPDDPDEALAWLEQLAGRPDTTISSEAAYTEDAPEVVEERETPAVPKYEVVEEQETPAVPEDAEYTETEAAEAEDAADEEMLAEIPEDPDEAMAWLEQLAARQGASLDELPSVEEVTDEVAIPSWLEREAEEAAREEAAREEAAREELAQEQLAPEEVAPEEAAPETLLEEEVRSAEEVAAEEMAGEAEDDLGWLDEMLDEESVRPVEEAETPVSEPPESDVELSDLDLDLPDTDVDESLPDWLSFDESGELAEITWEDEEIDVTDWLAAEEDITLHGPEEITEAEIPAAPAEGTSEGDAVEPRHRSEVARSDVPEGLNIDREVLKTAREAVDAGDYETSIRTYQTLLEQGEGLNLLIADLESALDEADHEPLMYRLLGDAYMRNGQLQKALESYRAGLDML